MQATPPWDSRTMLPEAMVGALGVSIRLKHVVSSQGHRSNGEFHRHALSHDFSSVDNGTAPSTRTCRMR